MRGWLCEPHLARDQNGNYTRELQSSASRVLPMRQAGVHAGGIMIKESRMHRAGSTVRDYRTPSFILLWVLTLLFITSCGDDPVESTPVPCNGQCITPFEECDTARNVCVLVGGDGDADMGPDSDVSLDSSTDDLSLADTSDDAVDLISDPDSSDETDSTDRADTDLAEDAGDLGDVPDDPDGAEDPEVETDPDVVADDGRGDDSEVSAGGICPLDFLETETSNNFFESASLLHPDSLLVGSSDCDDLAFDDHGATSDCVDDENCVCEEVIELGACQIDDPDFLRISFLAGDSAWVRVVFDEDADIDRLKADLDFALYKPTGVTVCADSSTCIGAEVCLGSRCQRALPGEWVMDRGEDVYEFNVGAAAPGEGQTGIVLDYVLKVKAHDYDVPYGVIVQVTPNSRSCVSDPWDADWGSYDNTAGNEVECTEASCTQAVGDIGTGPTTVGHLCPWDRQDVIRHQIGTGGSARFFEVKWFDTLDDLSATLWIKRGDDLELVTTLVPGGGENTLIAELSDMDAGTYQIVVSGTATTEFSVSVFNTD